MRPNRNANTFGNVYEGPFVLHFLGALVLMSYVDDKHDSEQKIVLQPHIKTKLKGCSISIYYITFSQCTRFFF